MLRIILHQFRCWEFLTIEITPGTINLIKGSSGVGKTTILQAIAWAFYGNIRSVNPNHIEKAKTNVTIEFPFIFNEKEGTLIVNRQKNPNRFILTHSSDPNIYEDKIAQSLVNELFGNYEIWLTSCYIGQNCRNNFLTAPNSGKMELLNNIAFHEEDPNFYIDKIDTCISETEIEYKEKLIKFNINLESFQKLCSNIDATKALSPDQINYINHQIETLTKELSSLDAVKNQRDINVRILENLQIQYDKANVEIPIPIPEFDLGSLQTCDIENHISNLRNIIPLLQRRNDLDSEVKRLNKLMLNHSKSDVTFTEIDYQDAVAKESLFNNQQILVKNLGIMYNSNTIKDSIIKYRDILDSQKYLKLEFERNSLYEKLQMMKNEKAIQTTIQQIPEIIPNNILAPDYSKYSTTSLSGKVTELSKEFGNVQGNIQQLEKSKDVLRCPQCVVSLRYQQGNLILADTNPIDLNELNMTKNRLRAIEMEIMGTNNQISALKSQEINARVKYESDLSAEHQRVNSLKEKIQQMEIQKKQQEIANQSREQKMIELNEKLDKITDQIKENTNNYINKKILSTQELEQTHSYIAKLSNIDFVELPKISSQLIQSHLRYQKLNQESVDAQIIYDEFLKNIPIEFQSQDIQSIQNKINKLQSYWDKIRKNIEDMNHLEKLKISLKEQMDSITIPADPTQRIFEIANEISYLKNLLELSEAAIKVITQHEIITKEREEVIKMNQLLADWNVLKQYAIETECQVLQQTADSINMSIQEVCNNLFDKDISITLNLFKTLKTSKTTKPNVNFSIAYQGHSYDNINMLSGGEESRLSIALTLALNRLSLFPLILLDESLSSLNIDMKEIAIKTIRENTGHTVLIILHDYTEGIFDTTFDIDLISDGRY